MTPKQPQRIAPVVGRGVAEAIDRDSGSADQADHNQEERAQPVEPQAKPSGGMKDVG